MMKKSRLPVFVLSLLLLAVLAIKVDKLNAYKIERHYDDADRVKVIATEPEMKAPLTREEVCVILNEFMDGSEDKKSEFSDVMGLKSEGAIANLVEMKILNGYPDGTFKPKNLLTHQELAVIMYRFVEKNVDMDKIEVAEIPELKNSFAKEEYEKLEALGFWNVGSKVNPKNNVFIGSVAEALVDYIKINEKQTVDTLNKYIKSVNLSVLEEEGIKTEKNAKAIENFKAKIEHAKTLIAKEMRTKEEFEEMAKLPYKKIKDKKVKGEFNSLAKKIHADMQVVGERVVENKDNHKKYPKLEGKKIILNTVHKDLGKFGEDENRYVKLNYISKEQYAAKSELDSVSGATPKYDKQEFPKDLYKVVKSDKGYTVEISEIPEDVAIIKPIIFIKLANGTYVEYGDMVYVK